MAWICHICGTCHKVGKPCPTQKSMEERVKETSGWCEKFLKDKQMAEEESAKINITFDQLAERKGKNE